MDKQLSAKQQKKLLEHRRRKTKRRVSEFRKTKKVQGDKLVQFYIGETEKAILDEYRVQKGLTISEVFHELITKILDRRLKRLSD